jgi:hypothetical protein
MIEGLIIFPATLIGIVCIVFGYLRYILLTNMNQKKLQMVQEKIHLNLRVIKFLASNYMFTIIIFITWILLEVIFLIVYASNRFICDTKTNLIVTIIVNVGVAIGVIVLVFVFFFDVYTNRRQIAKCDLLLFWRQDMMYQRTELYLFGLGMAAPIFIATGIVTIATQDILLRAIFNTIGYFGFIVMFPNLMTIYNIFYHCIKKPPAIGHVEKLLQNERGYQLLYHQCQVEYSIENIACWTDIRGFNKNPALGSAQEILEKYLRPGVSELEVNVTQQAIQVVVSKMSKGEVDNSLFSEIQKEVVRNMADTCNRLFVTKYYQVFIKIENLMTS